MNWPAGSKLGLVRAAYAITLGITVGLLLAVGGYTFIYARGASYLMNDPAACANCHVMQEQSPAGLHRVIERSPYARLPYAAHRGGQVPDEGLERVLAFLISASAPSRSAITMCSARSSASTARVRRATSGRKRSCASASTRFRTGRSRRATVSRARRAAPAAVSPRLHRSGKLDGLSCPARIDAHPRRFDRAQPQGPVGPTRSVALRKLSGH